MQTIISVICAGAINDRYHLRGESTYTHSLESDIQFAMLYAANLAAIPELSAYTIRVTVDSNFDSAFYILIEAKMNNCKTNNPNYILRDSSLDRSSIRAFFWDCVMGGVSDDLIYDCDVEECDHEFCMLTDVFFVTRSDRLLFPELESVSKVYIWNSEYTGIGYELITDNHLMPTYALGL